MDDLAEALSMAICVAMFHKQELAAFAFGWLFVSWTWAIAYMAQRK